MIKAFVENPRLVILVIAVLLVAGLAAITSLPLSEDPYITGRHASILTPYPGASAERVEVLVTEKIENKVRELPEIETITSSSRAGLSALVVELKGEIGPDQVSEIWSRMRAFVDEAAVELPAGVLPSRIIDNRSHAFTRILALRWQDDSEPDYAALGRYADELQSRLRGLPGTWRVEQFGRPVEEIQVNVDGQRLSRLGLTAADVGAAIARADSKVAAGQLVSNQSLAVEVRGAIDSVERVRQVPLQSPSQGSLLVRDVARVHRGEKTPLESVALIHGERAVVVAVSMLADERIDRWSDRVDQRLADFEALLPANVALESLFDQRGYTETRLMDLLGNVVLGFCLIVGVLLFTLGWRSALIVSLALPLTACFTLAVMKFYGLPIHQMSVTGLIVALGIMVDNAIVMVDSIARERAAGHDRVAAVSRSVRHLWLPLAGSTLTTILAFMPIVLMPGPAGEFVGGIALTVIFSLVGSYLISHTLIAGLAGRFLREDSQSGGTLACGFSARKLGVLFERMLHSALRRPLATLVAVGALPLLGFVAAGHLTEQFFPASDRDMFYMEIYLPEHYTTEATRQTVLEVNRYLQAEVPEITDAHWFIGQAAPAFYYNLMFGHDGAANFAQAMIKTPHFSVANRLIPALQAELDHRFPAAQILVRKLEQGPPFEAPVEVRLFGPDLDILKDKGNEVRAAMTDVASVTHTRSSLGSAVPKLWLDVDEDVARRGQFQLTDLSRQLANGLDGVVQGSLIEGTTEIPVRVRMNANDRGDLAELGQFNFVSPAGGSDPNVPLVAMASFEIAPTQGSIARRDGERVNTLQAFIKDGVLPAEVLTQLQKNLDARGFSLPPGYRLALGGEGAERDEAVHDLMGSVGLIITLLVLVVVLSFNSFRLSGIIFAVAIQSAGLGLLSVYLFGYAFGFTVIIGLLGLMGLAINAAIVILAELKSDANAVRGDEADIVAGVMRCSRHIVSTTITTVGGFLPLILAGGGFWPPFAIAIAGGTVLTTLLSFLFVPAAFILFARYRAFEQAQSQALV
ncbi:efflux RND transporter permease subunit [Simiduia agarivorans]|uniref:Acriflavin resistance protein n=1 Tax=Simiduia agarivorans (strain DSM 21679 / JCM 13881 / BCRC 17597 / SA1) TaxID=1117647 RepID=K4KNH9_SIMAS|nr:efflux RND transporter permease subunit [Simiduia agarivorans]AFV00602.1 acriflavin resistance protein [Simiduia agarivorans SA1 = DSM 21679]